MNSCKKKRMRKRRNPFFRCKGKYCRIKAEHQVHLEGALDVVCRQKDVPHEIDDKNGVDGKIENARTPNESIVKAVFYAITVSALVSAFLSNNDIHTIKASTVNVYGSLVFGSCGGEIASDSGRWMIPLAYFLFFTGYFYDEWRSVKNDSRITLETVKDSFTSKFLLLLSKVGSLSFLRWTRCIGKKYNNLKSGIVTWVNEPSAKRFLRPIKGGLRMVGDMLKFGELLEVLAWMSFAIQASLATQPYSDSKWWGVVGTFFATLSLIGNDAIWAIDLKKGWMIENVIWILALLSIFMSCYWFVFIVSISIFGVKVFFWIDRKMHIGNHGGTDPADSSPVII